MGNYYEGRLTFYLKKDIPEELVYDLYELSKDEIKKENLSFLKNTKWIQHERFSYPHYYFESAVSDEGIKCWNLEIDFCMKGYQLGFDLGSSIYDVLKPYIEERLYDMSYGGSIGHIEDEDDTYDKIFYIDEELLEKEMERRSYICNKDCWYFRDKRLCDRYKWCERVYKLGRESVYEETR